MAGGIISIPSVMDMHDTQEMLDHFINNLDGEYSEKLAKRNI